MQASPACRVGEALVADGRVELGFQQASEMMNVPGIAVLGPCPPGCEIVTLGSLCMLGPATQAVRAFA
ncbi:MAG: hypothetical protein M5R42_12860 [Rhodocyclaceae bacterium]|nr:hypothetical protein [Rhodocyclaceae bacterium]